MVTFGPAISGLCIQVAIERILHKVVSSILAAMTIEVITIERLALTAIFSICYIKIREAAR